MTLARLLRIVRHRLRSLVRRGALDQELDEELTFHIEQLTREQIAAGLPADGARVAARRLFGNATLVAEESREARGMTWLDDLVRDVAYGLRGLGASPGVTCLAVVSLAVGIGASAAVFGAVNAMLVRPLPFPGGDRLVRVAVVAADQPGQPRGASAAEYLAWKERATTIESIGASSSGSRDVTDARRTLPVERVAGQAFTPSMFAMLGVRPRLGGLPGEDADPFGKAARVVMLSHRFWLRRFGGDEAIIGQEIQVDRALRRVVGIMSPAFKYQDDSVDCWIPLLFDRAAAERSIAPRLLTVTARLKPGIAMPRAQAELGAISDEVARGSGEDAARRVVQVTSLRDAMYGWARPRLLTLQSAAVLVLLVACANVAGLLLARGASRQREMAIRLAIGAGPGRLVRQLLAESLVLAGLGGALGIVAARWGLGALSASLGPPPGAPRPVALHVNADVLGAAIVLSAITALAFGLAPALAGSRLNVLEGLNASAPSVGVSRRTRRRRGVLVAAQIGLAVVLLVGAGLLATSFLRLTGRDVNLDARGLLTFDYDMRPSPLLRVIERQHDGVASVEVSPALPLALEHVEARLRSIPGVTSVAGISFPPVNAFTVPRVVLRPSSGRGAGATTAAYFLVSPGYFAALRTPLVGGREFDAGDTDRSRAVAVVNEAAARRLWPRDNPVGQFLGIQNSPGDPPREVIGVVRDVPVLRRQLESEPVVYVPYRQPPARYRGEWATMFTRMTFVLRTPGDPSGLLPAARRAVAEVDPDHPIVEIGTLERHLQERLPEARNYAVGVALLALAATLLAALGVYGVTAYTVSQRTREIGIRKALGASTAGVATLVAGRVALVAGAGIAAGLASAAALARLIEPQLWGVGSTDPATYAGAALVVLTVALAACLFPVRRALAVDPTTALRAE